MAMAMASVKEPRGTTTGREANTDLYRVRRAFLARVPKGMPVKEIILLAEEYGPPITRAWVYAFIRDVELGNDTWPKQDEPLPRNVMPANKISGADFIRRWPMDMPIKAVVAEARKQKIFIDDNEVRTVRWREKKKAEAAELHGLTDPPPPAPASAVVASEPAPPTVDLAQALAAVNELPEPAAAVQPSAPVGTLTPEEALWAIVLEIGLPATERLLLDIGERVKELFSRGR